MMDPADDSTESENEDLDFTLRKHFTKGSTASMNTPKKKLEQNRNSKLSPPKKAEEGDVICHFVKAGVALSAKRTDVMHPVDDSTESDNEDLDIGDRKPFTKGSTALPNTQKKKQDQNRKFTLSRPKKTDDGDVIPHIKKDCVALSAKRTVVMDPADDGTESGNEYRDIGDRKPFTKGSAALPSTQKKKLEQNSNSKLSRPKKDEEGDAIPRIVKNSEVLSAKRTVIIDPSDDSTESDNEDLDIGDRKPFTKGSKALPNTKKKMQDQNRKFTLSRPKKTDDGDVIPHVEKDCVALSAKRTVMMDPADDSTESDTEDLDISDRRHFAKRSTALSTTQKKLNQNKNCKQSQSQNAEEGDAIPHVVKDCVVLSTKRTVMVDSADDSTESGKEYRDIGDRKTFTKGSTALPSTQKKKLETNSNSKLSRPKKAEEGDAIPRIVKNSEVLSAKRTVMIDPSDDSTESDNEDLDIGDRKPFTKGSKALPNTQKKKQDQNRNFTLSRPNKTDDGDVIPHVKKDCVALSAKRTVVMDPADDSTESDNEDLDIGDRKPLTKGSTALPNTQKKKGSAALPKFEKKKMEQNRRSKLLSPKEAEEGYVIPHVIKGCVASSAKRTVMMNPADNSTESASLSYSKAMSDKKFWMSEETQLSTKDNVHDMPCVPLQKLAGHAGDMKAEKDESEAVSVLKQLVKLAESVGLIISPSACGTGFHVGPGYIITAKHVVNQILKGAPVLLRQQKHHSPHHQLSSPNVFIDFSYERNGQTSDENLRFHFEPLIVYVDDHLDTVILKLKKDPNKMYPPHLTTFAQLPDDVHSGYLIGHSNADVKKTDKYQRVTLAPQTLNDAKEWSLKHAKVDDYIGIDDPQRVLLHCSFNKGASGSPGFWIRPNDSQSYVVLMLLRGYPDWYYDDKYKQEKKIGIPPNCLIEQGVSMTSISEDMQKRNPSLWQKIFCCSDEDEEMED